MSPSRLALACAAASTLAPASLGVDLRVEVASAVAPGPSLVRIHGDPGRPFSLFVAREEGTTPIDELITLSIAPVRQLAAGFVIAGQLNLAGDATFVLQASGALVGGRLSYQAASTVPDVQVSNVCRALYLAPNSCGTALGAPAGVSLNGDLFPLADGRLLSIGGAGTVVSTYEPTSHEFTLNGLASAANAFETRTLLADGRVLVAGGIDVVSGQPVASASVYDPLTGTSTSTRSMTTARAGAAAARLPNGKVLVVGGIATLDLTDLTTLFGAILGSSELYDPATNAFVAGPNLSERKAFATATLLNNNQVLVAGGLGVVPIVNVPYVSNTAYTYSAGTNTFGLFPKTFTGGRLFHSATKLPDGRVMLVGGINADLTAVIQSGDLTQIAFATIATTAVYSTSGLGSFSNGPTLAESRAFHTATALPSGRILVAGGISGQLDIGAITGGTIRLPAALATTELLGPSAVRAGPPLTSPRAGAAAAIESVDGRVVIVGGGAPSVDLYQP